MHAALELHVIASMAALAVGCGGRSQLADAAGSGPDETAEDRCPSAVSGPKAMTGNCSTRDGRARVAAPSAPHLTWKSTLPVGEFGGLGLALVSTDAAGHAYVVNTPQASGDPTAIRRVRAADGAIEWTTPIQPATETETPILRTGRAIELLGYDAMSVESMLTFDPETGAPGATTFGLDLYYAGGDPAIGADGSQYLVHANAVGTATMSTHVSRIGPEGEVIWTSVDLGSLGPPPNNVGSVFPWTPALGERDLVIIAADVITATGPQAFAGALDPESGAPRWTTSVPGQLVGRPTIRPDGSAAVLTSSNGESRLVLFDPLTGAATTRVLPSGFFSLFGALPNGDVLAGADDGAGITGVAAITAEGQVRWTHAGAEGAVIATGGTVVTLGRAIPNIDAVDAESGALRWQLAAPSPGACLLDAALTSAGGIVAVQCDGTMFGASD